MEKLIDANLIEFRSVRYTGIVSRLGKRTSQTYSNASDKGIREFLGPSIFFVTNRRRIRLGGEFCLMSILR
jgi:hypothetical protein